MGRTLLSDALTLVLPLLLVLVLPMWVGHSCPTLLTLLLILGLTLPLMLKRQVWGRTLLSDAFHVGAEVDPSTRTRPPATSL